VARQILILAKSPIEASRYAKLVDLPRFTYRYVARAGTIRGVRSAEVHVLPSFLNRLDRHGILAALRLAKLDVYYVDPVDFVEEAEVQVADPMPEIRVVAVSDDVEPPQHHVDMVAAVLPNGSTTDWESEGGATEQQIMAENDGTPVGEVEEKIHDAQQKEQDVKEPARKRRYRCPVCNQLVWNDEDVDHDADAHETAAALEKEQAAPANPGDSAGFWG